MAVLNAYALGQLGQYGISQQLQQHQLTQQAMLQQLVPAQQAAQQAAWTNVYTLQYGTDSTTAAVTVKANLLDYYEPVPGRDAIVKRSNEAWLDQRVNEMRVAL